MTRTLPNPRAIEMLGLFAEQARDHALICLDAQGSILGWLGAAEEIFGYSAGEVLGKSIAGIFTSEDQARRLDRYELELAAMNSRAEDDRWHVRKDGTRIWASGSVTAIRDGGGQLLGFVKVVRDRTDLRSRVETLEAQAAALRDSRDRTHAFLKTLGHELRNPLGPLSNAVHIISRLSKDGQVENALQIVSRQIAVLTRLADDLMDVSRLEAGKVNLERKRVDVRDLLMDAAQSLQKAAAAKNIRLQTLLPQAPLFVDLDEARFQQVVLNLIGNAIKYTPEAGAVWVKATQTGSDILVKVEDNGIGIAPGMLSRIFDLFTQVSATEDFVPGGLGVGLAIVRQIVELHGGSVQARSAGVGKGSEFSVLLPAPAQRPG